MADKTQIRRARRSKAIASEFDLCSSGDWVYCVKRGSTTHRWRRRDSEARARAAERELLQDSRLDCDHAMIMEYLGDAEEVEVPAEIEGIPVLELHNKVFYENRRLKKVTLPNSIVDIGLKVFGLCRNLEEVRFSDSIVKLDNSIFAGCKSLKRIKLPRNLEIFESRLVSKMHLECIEIPACTKQVVWPETSYSIADKVYVNDENPLYSSDGIALYNKDATTLVKAIANVEEYTVLDSCESIAASAFKGMSALRRLNVNRGLRRISAYAFFNTGIEELELPSTVTDIEPYAFSMCQKLSQIRLGGGLEVIGDHAFAKTNVQQAWLPASLRRLGEYAFAETRVRFGKDPTFFIDTYNKTLSTDGFALYMDGPQGVKLIRLLADMDTCTVDARCNAIADEAFVDRKGLKSAIIPEGVVEIGSRAFENCAQFEHIELPNTLERIGESAFAGTSLHELSIGRATCSIGLRALCVAPTSDNRHIRPLSHVEVHPGNPVFYTRQNLLIERMEQGDKAVCCFGTPGAVAIPHEVTSIADRCFSDTAISVLEVHDHIKVTAPEAFHGLSGLERVRVAFPHAIDGFSEVSVVFPGGQAAAEGAARSLGIDADGLFFRFSEYDAWIMHYWLLNKKNSLPVAKMILARLDSPVKLSPKAASDMDKTMRVMLSTLCREYT